MKKWFFLTLACLFVLMANSQRRNRFAHSINSAYSIGMNDTLVYDVKKGEERYELIVVLKNYGDSIRFDYSIPSKNKHCTIMIFPNSVQNAVAYVVDIENDILNLKEKGALVLSKKAFKDLRNEPDQATLNVGKGLETFYRDGGQNFAIKFKKGNTFFNYFEAKSDNNNKMWIMDSEKNPLILRVERGDYRIHLLEIK
jgi:hypothetical protein